MITIDVLVLSLLAFHYVIYPAIVLGIAYLLRLARSVDMNNGDYTPTVTLLIAAYNEEKVIDEKIQNSLQLNYPAKKLQIIVVSDGSGDGTADIVKRYLNNGVVSMHEPERNGKTAALNRAIAHTESEIIVMSDANNLFNKDSIRFLVRHFENTDVGGVCGVKSILQDKRRESSTGDGLYWKYESAIKQAESQINSITCGDGEIFAIRNKVVGTIDELMINDDAEITLSLHKKGYRILYDKNAVSYEYASHSLKDDFYVKVRMVAGGFQTLQKHYKTLFGRINWFNFAFFSHKTLRYIAPLLLITLFVNPLFALGHGFNIFLTVSQIIFYAVAGIGYFLIKRGNSNPFTYIPSYFSIMNLAALYGLFRFLRGKQKVQWRKASR